MSMRIDFTTNAKEESTLVVKRYHTVNSEQ